MTTQAKNLKAALKSVGIKARVRTEKNSHGEFGEASAVVEINDAQEKSLVALGCKVINGGVYSVVSW